MVKRQSGRFVLPVTVRLRHTHWVDQLRGNIHNELRQVPLPQGVDLEHPELDPAAWTSERLRLLAIAATFPILLLALAICRLNSLLGGAAGGGEEKTWGRQERRMRSLLDLTAVES